MAKYDKDEVKDKLSTEMVFDIVQEFGGDPYMTDFGFISATICHNAPGEGSRKLYYYDNTKLFRCYTGCDSYFDIFELLMKIKLLSQPDSEWGLYDSVRWVASRYGWGPTIEDAEEELPNLADWKILERYEKLDSMKLEPPKDIILPEYDTKILDNLSYPIIWDWMKEGMTKKVLDTNRIGYYPTAEQITIPHFDIRGRFIGLRGRALGEQDAELHGKYRPLIVGHQMYNHPLGLNLYNINNSAENIKKIRKAIIFEGEKSCLLYQSYFGISSDISVACCGSSISSVQISTLLNLGAEEIIVAFDRQFKQKNDEEFKHQVKNFKALHKKYSQFVLISFMFDKDDVLPYKASPIDCGPEIFMKLYKERVML